MQRGLMHEDLLRAIIRDYEPKPFAYIEPFHLLERARASSVARPRASKFIPHEIPHPPLVRRARASPRVAARTTGCTNSLCIFPCPHTPLLDVARAHTSPRDRAHSRAPTHPQFFHRHHRHRSRGLARRLPRVLSLSVSLSLSLACASYTYLPRALHRAPAVASPRRASRSAARHRRRASSSRAAPRAVRVIFRCFFWASVPETSVGRTPEAVFNICTGTHSCNSQTTRIGLIRIMYEFGGLNL